MLEKKITNKELLKLKDTLNPAYVTPTYLNEILDSLNQSPVIISDDLSNPPENNKGLVICRECKNLYWITSQRDVHRGIEGHGKEIPGPFCTPCFYDTIKTLRQ